MLTNSTPGGFWLAFGVTSIPFYNAAGAYSSSGTNMLQGEASPEYQATFGKLSKIVTSRRTRKHG